MRIESVTRAQVAGGEMLGAIPVLPRNITHSCEQHDAVVDAILSGDAEAARGAMEEHCDATSALLRGLIGRRRRSTHERIHPRRGTETADSR